MSERIYFGRLEATVSEVVDAVDLLPNYELAAIAVLEGQERPGEEPAVRRRLRSEGIRPREHRGALLVEPGEMERCSSAGLLSGGDEVFFATEWNDEFEPFPGRVANDDFDKGTPLGLDEWMLDAQCLLALGDAAGVNFASYDPELAARLRARFPAPK